MYTYKHTYIICIFSSIPTEEEYSLLILVCMYVCMYSASNFTSDCLKYRCTSMLYIGELCRYLVNMEPKANDKHLALKSAFGNGESMYTYSRYDFSMLKCFYAQTL